MPQTILVVDDERDIPILMLTAIVPRLPDSMMIRSRSSALMSDR